MDCYVFGIGYRINLLNIHVVPVCVVQYLSIMKVDGKIITLQM